MAIAARGAIADITRRGPSISAGAADIITTTAAGAAAVAGAADIITTAAGVAAVVGVADIITTAAVAAGVAGITIITEVGHSADAVLIRLGQPHCALIPLLPLDSGT